MSLLLARVLPVPSRAPGWIRTAPVRGCSGTGAFRGGCVGDRFGLAARNKLWFSSLYLRCNSCGTAAVGQGEAAALGDSTGDAVLACPRLWHTSGLQPLHPVSHRLGLPLGALPSRNCAWSRGEGVEAAGPRVCRGARTGSISCRAPGCRCPLHQPGGTQKELPASGLRKKYISLCGVLHKAGKDVV